MSNDKCSQSLAFCAIFEASDNFMLQLTYLREKKDEAIVRLSKKIANAQQAVEAVLAIDDTRRAAQKELDDLLAASNKLAKEIGDLYKSGKREEADALKQETAANKDKSKEDRKSVV